MYKPDIQINEDANVYVSIRNWMEYSIDDSVECCEGNFIIDLHKQEMNNKDDNYNYLLVGIEIRNDEYIKLLDINKTEYVITDEICYIRFYAKQGHNSNTINGTINSIIINPNIEIYYEETGILQGIIVRRNLDLEKIMNNLRI